MNQVHSTEPSLPSFVRTASSMLIDGKFVDAQSGEVIEIENPAKGRVIATVPAGDKRDVDMAVRAARKSFEDGRWRKLSAVKRERILWRLSDLMEREIDELATLETLNNGMPIGLVRRAIERAIDGFRYYAGMCTKLAGRTVNISGERAEFHAYSLLEPIGVAALIVPWNSPLAAACNKVAPALAAGCSAILKPAEQTPLSAIRLAELALQAGVPDGVLNVVTGYGHAAGAALANHPNVDKISFTGSTAVGKELIRASAGNMKRLSLELGGKSPVFVFADADLKTAIPRAAAAIFSNSGQICYAGSRLYVQRNCFDDVVAGIAEIAQKTRVGDGLDPKTEMGPVISEAHCRRVLGYIESAREDGMEIVTGGRRLDREGYFISPTVVTNVNPKSKLVREEVFGPVVAAMPFDDLEDAISSANDTRYGLGAGVFTRNISTAHRLANRIQAGNIWINFYGGTDKSLPFGGYKESGWGREGSVDGIEAFMEKKAVYIRL